MTDPDPDARLVRTISGPLGIAVQWQVPLSTERIFGRHRWSVAEWTMRAHGPDRPVTTMCAVMTHMQTSLVLCRIDRAAVESYTNMGLPAALGVHVLAAFGLHVETDHDRAIGAVMEYLARSAVTDQGPVLDIYARTPQDQQAWMMAADTAARFVQSGRDLADLEIVAF